jgi:hypothetical protein
MGDDSNKLQDQFEFKDSSEKNCQQAALPIS